MDWDRLGLARVFENPTAVEAASLAGLILASWIALHIARRILVVGIRVFAAKSSVQWDDRLVDTKLFIRLAQLAPALVFYYGADWIPDLNETISLLIRRLSVSAIALVVALSISSFLNAVDEIYSGLSAYHRYLKNHSQLHRNMTLLVRQRDPPPQRLPIETYCFATTTDWNACEGIQRDLIDHLFGVAPDFGLRAFQNPSGQDLCELTHAK